MDLFPISPEVNDILDDVKEAAIGAGIDRIKSVFQKVFKKKPDLFKQKALQSVNELEEHFGKDLFGGDIREKMLEPEAIAEYKKWLLPFEEPDFKVLGGIMDFKTLPENFLTHFRSLLLNNLYQDREFRSQLHEKLMLLLIEKSNKTSGKALRAIKKNKKVAKKRHRQTKQKLDETLNNIEAIRTLLEKLHRPVEHPVVKKTVKRNVYKFDHDYIERSIYEMNSKSKLRQHEVSLIEFSKASNRIFLLSAGGLGMTIELEHLADHYSRQENERFYPVFCRLNYYTGEEIEAFVRKEFADLNHVSLDQLVLIFDGLDEVHKDYFDIAIKKIVAFGNDDRYRNSKIIISCRDNLFNPEFSREYPQKEQYVIIKLKEIEYRKILRHGYATLGADLANLLFQQIQQQGLTAIATNPFFYHGLVELFRQDNKLPGSKVEIFESLIKKRIEKDKQRWATSGVDLHKKSKQVRAQIERLALVMTTSGKNYVTDEDLEDIISGVENRQLVERSFLFNRFEENNWKFEHNNFQEYLAARKMSSIPLDEIKKLVTIPGDDNKISPTWVNTLSFLFLVFPENSQSFSELFNWIMTADRELILRFEKERVDLPLREEFFKATLEHYQNQGLLTRSTKFDSRDLTQFISESRDVFTYLIGRLQTKPSGLIISEIAGMLPDFEHANEYRVHLQPVLEGFIKEKKTDEITRYYCAHALASLNWQSEAFFEQLLKSSAPKKSQYGRAGIYKYLIGSEFLDFNVPLIIKLIRFDDRSPYFSDKPDLGDENIYRDEAIRAIKSIRGIQTILKFVADSAKNGKHDFLLRTMLGDILKNAADLYHAGRDEIFGTVLKTFQNSLRESYQAYGEEFRTFFSSTNTIERACQKFLKGGEDSSLNLAALAILIDDSLIDFLVKQYEGGKLKAKKVNDILYHLRVQGDQSKHDRFYRLINVASSDKFKYHQRPDYNKINADRKKKDLELLLNREQFLNRIEQIYQREQTDSIEKRHIVDFHKTFMRGDEEDIDNNLAIKTLQRNFEQPVDKDHVMNHFKDDDKWESFQIRTLLKYDVENYIALTYREVNFILSWCRKAIHKTNFRKHHGHQEVTLAYFISRFDFQFPSTVYLDLLHAYSNAVPVRYNDRRREERESLADWIIGKVGLDAVKNRVVENLKNGLTVGSVIRNHIAIATRHNIKEALPHIPRYFEIKLLGGYSLVHALEDYLKLGGMIKYAENFLENPPAGMDEHEVSQLEDILVDFRSSKIKGILINKLETVAKQDDKPLYARKLMKLGQVEGLTHYRVWVQTGKSFDDFISASSFKAIPTKDALPEMLLMGAVLMQPNFSRQSLHGQDQDLFYSINERALESETYFQMVRAQYAKWIDEQKPNAFVRYYLNDLETKYYSTLAGSRSLAASVKLVDTIAAT